MGLFSSKKKHFVDTSVNRVVKDEDLPEMAKEALLKSIMSGANISSELTEAALNSSVYDFDRMYRYGRDRYSYGLPNTHITGNEGPNLMPRIQQVLDSMVGREVLIDYAEMGPMDTTHAAYQILVDQYDYNVENNEIESLSQAKGTSVWLHNIQPLLAIDVLEEADAGTLVPLGFPATSGYAPTRPAQQDSIIGRYRQKTEPQYVEDGGADYEEARVTYAWWEDGEVKHAYFDFLMEFDNIDTDYFQAKFRYTYEGQTIHRYFSYERGEGSFPMLDSLIPLEYIAEGSYFPFVMFRTDDTNRTASKYHDTEAYKTATKLLDYISMDYQEIGDAIHENPDIDDVEQAFMMMGVRADSEDPVDQQYLYMFFERLESAGAGLPSYYARGGYVPFAPSGYNTRSYRAIRFSDADFSMSLSYRKISRRECAGRIGPIGTVKALDGSETETIEYTVRRETGGDGAFEMVRKSKDISVKAMVYQKQTTPHAYTEITVIDPRMSYTIYKGKGVSASLGDERLLVPIDRDLSMFLKVQDRERLYLRSLNYVFNSRITEKVKWYESGLFQFVLTAAAIVITIYSFGSGYPALAAALAAGSYAAAAWIVLVAVVKMVVIQEGLKLVAEEIGAEAAFIVALAMAVYGGFRGFQAGSVKGAPFAGELMKASSGLLDAVNDMYAEKLADIVGEQADLVQAQEDRMNALSEIEKELDFKSLLDPLTFVGMRPVTVYGETPDQFYNRTVHSGNIGITAIDAIHNHAEVGLRLPTFNDTMGGTFYA